MNFSFYIAKRYLISKKSTNVINLISGITVFGVATSTMALIVILSVFNGLESFVTSQFNSFDPDIKITIVEGKTFDSENSKLEKVRNLENVKYYAEVVEENALIMYKEISHPFVIKGVGGDYEKMTGVDTMIIDGEFKLHMDKTPLAVMGSSVGGFLSVRLDFLHPLKVYMPKRTGKAKNIIQDPTKAFKVKSIYPIGVFSIDQEIDETIIVPIDFVRELLDYKTEVNAIELKLNENADVQKIKKKIQNILGNAFEVKDRYQQKEFMYKIMKSEKLIIFLILTFILLIASFNIIGSLTMLILDKKKDIETLRSMGANMRLIKKIFLFEGWIISFVGVILGLGLGALLCWAQTEFELVKLQGDADTLYITVYPVEMQLHDFLYVLLTVFFIGFIASWYPIRYITRKYLSFR